MPRSPLRSHHRFPRKSARFDCQVVREHDFRLMADRITDLSPGGMLVTPADPAITGERLIVSFQVPGSSYWIDTEATVARVIHGRRPGDTTRALGLNFEDLHPFARFMLEKSLRFLPPTPPKARAGRRKMPDYLLANLVNG